MAARAASERTGKPVTLTWDAMNRALEDANTGAPRIPGYDEFTKLLDSTPVLQNMIDNKTGRVDGDGVEFDLNSTTATTNSGGNPGQPPIDPTHGTVTQTAMHALKSK